MNDEMRHHRRRRQHRRGVVLIATLVCLGVIVGLLMMALQTSLGQTRRLNRELQMEQTRWLARAASDHAENLLADETRITQRVQLERYPDAEVTIERASDPDSANVSVRVRIGMQNRPELQTQIMISTETGSQGSTDLSETQE